MIKPEKAKKFCGEIRNLEGEIKRATHDDIFQEDEYEKAEAITEHLKGMTIASATRLLEKVKEYILCSVIE